MSEDALKGLEKKLQGNKENLFSVISDAVSVGMNEMKDTLGFLMGSKNGGKNQISKDLDQRENSVIEKRKNN